MQHFTDTSGHKWGLDVTFSAIKRIKMLTDVDLVGDRNALMETMSDDIQMVDVVYSICKPEADQLGITDVDFGERLDGETAQKAREAFADAMVDFTHPDRREALSAGIDALMTAERKLIEAATANATDPAWQAEIDAEIEHLVKSFRVGSPSTN